VHGSSREGLIKRLRSSKPEFVTVIGRRRNGKTFLAKQVLKDHIAFQFTGLYKSNLNRHMERFAASLSRKMDLPQTLQVPKSWFEAFDILRVYLDGIKGKKKKVIFLDELPWMSTNRSRFLTAFADFWNDYAADK
jgi:AAA+ ATPase superfamily predicted ATPase